MISAYLQLFSVNSACQHLTTGSIVQNQRLTHSTYLHLLQWIFAVGVLTCIFMAWGIGANDVANSFATSVGARALTLRQVGWTTLPLHTSTHISATHTFLTTIKIT